jgi:plastocyanin
MKNSENNSKKDNQQANESRRAFLSKGILLAGGIMLTPLWLEGCGGGDNQGDGRTAKKKKSGGGGGAPSGDGGSTDGGSTTPEAGKYQCVDPSELGSKQSVKVTVKYKGEHLEWTDPKLKKTGLAGDDGARAQGDVEVEKYYPEPTPLGTKYVVEEKVLTIKDGDSVRLCNCFVVLDPRGVAKVAKNPHSEMHVLNHYFRFEPRIHDIATKGQVSWENKDPVNHAIATSGITPTGLPAVPVSDGGTAAFGKSVTTKINDTSAGFFKKGYYGVNCSLHAWELGRIFVSDHAYVGVSSKENKCVVGLDNVADGSYELQIWHESAATPIKTMPVEIKAGAVEFSVDLEKIS